MPGDRGPPLNILQVLRAPVGGLFRHVRDLTELLAARGNRVGIAVDSITFDALTEERLRALAPHAALGIHRIAMPRLLGPGDLTAARKIRTLIADLRAGIVHGHGAKGGFHARLAARGDPGVAAFYTPHGGVLHFPPKSLQGRAFRAVERWLLPRTASIFFESEFARSAFAAEIADPGERALVVHNGLRPEEFLPIQSSGEFDFVFVGEIRELKGIDLLVGAMAALDRPGDRPVSLLVVGDGPDRRKIEERIARTHMRARITVSGAMPARQAFARGNCIVVPSRRESLPYVVLEAAAAGMPMIATSAGGIPEIFGPTSGALVAPGDSAALRRAMQAALIDPKKIKLEASTRREFVRQNFDAGAMASAIEAGYRHALHQR